MSAFGTCLQFAAAKCKQQHMWMIFELKTKHKNRGMDLGMDI